MVRNCRGPDAIAGKGNEIGLSVPGSRFIVGVEQGFGVLGSPLWGGKERGKGGLSRGEDRPEHPTSNIERSTPKAERSECDD
jgi:hypothetical protein